MIERLAPHGHCNTSISGSPLRIGWRAWSDVQDCTPRRHRPCAEEGTADAARGEV